MFKKLKPGETEEDVLRMAAEFNAEREKNPYFQPAATVVRVEKRKCCHINTLLIVVKYYFFFELNKAPTKSLFAQKREKAKLQNKESKLPQQVPDIKDDMNSVKECIENNKVLLDEIHENILGDVRGTKVNHNLINVLGELVERKEGKLRPAVESRSQVNITIMDS